MKLSQLDLDTTYLYRTRSRPLVVGRYTGRVNSEKMLVEINDLRQGDVWINPSNLSSGLPVHDVNFWDKIGQQEITGTQDILELAQIKPGLMVSSDMFKYCQNSEIIKFMSLLEIWFVMQFERLKIKWAHESREFDLGDCGFVPDFYLANSDLYLEITTSPRSTKRRKMLGMLDRFPEIQLVCISRGKINELVRIIQGAQSYQEIESWLCAHQEPWSDRKLGLSH